LEEISKQKNLLSKLESFLKEFPGNAKVDEDEAEEIEDEVVKRGEPKSLEDKEGEKEEDKEVGGSNEVADEEETETEETEEETPNAEETETEEETEETAEPKEDSKPSRSIMSFEDFIKEDETINKNVSYRDDEDEEDNAELDAASADPLAETEVVDASGLAIPLVTGDGTKTAEEIEDKKVAMGEPEELKDVEGEALVTKDQTVTSTVTGQGSVIKSFAAFVKESEVVDGSGLAIPLVTGDGTKTAEEIEDKKVAMGEPEILKDEEGEALVTKDQVVTEDPKTSKDEPANTVIESTLNEGVYSKTSKRMDIEEAKDKRNKILNVIRSNREGFGFCQLKDEGNKAFLIIKASKDDKYNIERILNESQLNEEEINTKEEFTEYATKLLKNAFGDDYDEAKATEVIDGLLSKYGEDFGAMVGALQSSMN
jgi:hypothetical protein